MTVLLGFLVGMAVGCFTARHRSRRHLTIVRDIARYQTWRIASQAHALRIADRPTKRHIPARNRR